MIEIQKRSKTIKRHD